MEKYKVSGPSCGASYELLGLQKGQENRGFLHFPPVKKVEVTDILTFLPRSSLVESSAGEEVSKMGTVPPL